MCRGEHIGKMCLCYDEGMGLLCGFHFTKLDSLCKSHLKLSSVRYFGSQITVCPLKYQKGEKTINIFNGNKKLKGRTNQLTMTSFLSDSATNLQGVPTHHRASNQAPGPQPPLGQGSLRHAHNSVWNVVGLQFHI